MTRWAAAVAVLGLACGPAGAGGYLDSLDQASPAAAALLYSKAPDWRAASPIVKDRAGFLIFERTFPNKAQMSINDMIACIDKEAAAAAPTTAVLALINSCSGL